VQRSAFDARKYEVVRSSAGHAEPLIDELVRRRQRATRSRSA
jgi:hypothetical protein